MLERPLRKGLVKRALRPVSDFQHVIHVAEWLGELFSLQYKWSVVLQVAGYIGSLDQKDVCCSAATSVENLKC